MRGAERFGSYSMATTVAQTPRLLAAAEVDDPMYIRFVAAASQRRRCNDALVVASRPLLLGRRQDQRSFSGFFLRSVMSAAKSLTEPLGGGPAVVTGL